MSFNYRHTIFGLFGAYEKQQDINVDVDGKGTHERYNEIVGKYIDEELLIRVDKIVDFNLDPNTAYDRFVPYLEDRLGVDFYIYDDIEWRRRVLRLVMTWYKIKGTIKCYKLMLGMLGFEVEIIEYLRKYSFDSPVTFDDVDRRFDMGCRGCAEYDILLTGEVVITPSIILAIENIIYFNEPINARLKRLLYNGTSLVHEIITVEILDNGDLVYYNEYDPQLVITLAPDGSFIISGPRSNRYSINASGDLIYTY